MYEEAGYQYDLFVLYADADRAWVEGYLLDALEAAGVRLCSEEAFRLGVPRILEFERAVQESQWILLVLSSAYLREHLNQFVDILSQSYGLETATWQVIPLLLEPVDLPPRLSQLVALQATDPDTWDEVVTRLLRSLQRPPTPPLARPPCPYPGMVPFGEEDSERFYGRDREVENLLERLRLHRFLAIIGPSGSGKSSLVFAGLIPALRRSGLFGSGKWLVRSMRPGDRPLANLEALLGGDLPASLQSLEDLLALEPDAHRLLLVVDQFEELFTFASEEDTRDFQRALLQIAENPDCYVVLTVRADSYPDLMEALLWTEIQAHRAEILPLDEEGLRQAIVRPAEEVDVFVETTLAERLVGDAAGEPGILPFVQETLVLLWERVERRFLPLRAYEALILSARSYRELGAGHLTGLQVAMARRADSALQDLPPDQQTIARRVFLRLVQFGEGRADTRRQQTLADLCCADEQPGLLGDTVSKLAAQRLLTLGGAEESPRRTVDLAHEALIEGWPRLQSWLTERREALLVRRRLEAKAAEWERLGCGSGGLLDHVELREAERWLAGPDASDVGYQKSLLTLVGASRRAIQRSLWLRIGAVASVVVFIITAVSIYALLQREAAEREAALRRQVEIQLAMSQSRQVAATARNRLESGDAQQALLLGIAAMQQITETREAADVLRDALHTWRGEAVLLGHEARVSRVVFSPNGQYLISISDDNTARLWQMAGERLVLSLRGHTRELTDVAFSPNSQLVVTASRDGTTRIWDVSTGRALHVLDQGGDVVALHISPDGQTLATGSEDGEVWLWDLETGEPVRSEPFRAEGAIQDVAFCPDRPCLVAASTDGTAWLWDLPSGAHARLTGHEAVVGAIDFHPDGRYVATRSGDTVRMWSMDGLEPVRLRHAQHGAAIVTMGFSPDGNYLTTGSQDTTAQIWDLRRLDADPLVLHGHSETVWAAMFSPDSRLLVTAGWDDRACLWQADGGALEAVLTGHGSKLWTPDFSPDGTLLATPDEEGTVRLWRVQASGDEARHLASVAPATDLAVAGADVVIAGEDGIVDRWQPATGRTHTYRAGESRLEAAAATADGSLLAIGDAEGQIRLVDMATDSVVASWPAHANGIHALLFAPDGMHLASAGGDTRIRFWDPRTGRLEQELRGHENDVNGLAWETESGTLFSASSDGTVRQWNWQAGEALSTFQVGDPLHAIAYAPATRSLAAGSDSAGVYIWDLGAPEAGPINLPHERAVRALSFADDGNLLATGGDDGQIWLWDVQQREAATIPAHGACRVDDLVFSPDKGLLFSAGVDGWVRAWPVHTTQVLQLGCQRAGRNLSKAEWETFLSFRPFTELCPDVEAGGWRESTQLDAPRAQPARGHVDQDPRPTIRYFEAIPGCRVHSGEQITLRWDGIRANAVYLEYDGARYGVTSPDEKSFLPRTDTTYRLIAVNDAGERSQTLVISVDED